MGITKKCNVGCSILKGALLVGTIAAGVVGVNIIAQAYENKITKDCSEEDPQIIECGVIEEDYNTITVPANEIKDEEELEEIVADQGTQIIVDDNTGDMYVAYMNEDDKMEVAEIDENDLNELISVVNSISNGEVTVEEAIDDLVEDGEFN